MHTETWVEIATDPNHIIAELIWSLIFDGLFVAVLYGIVWKKLLLPKIHEQFDKQHGLTHKENE